MADPAPNPAAVRAAAALQPLVDAARRIVFFGGAGVSTESGIPDFRGQDGLYRQTYRWPPEVILSRDFCSRHPEEFFRFHRARMVHFEARPNAAHRRLAQWEQAGRLTAVITQNIDGLHQAAGSNQVHELHGSVWRNHCRDCGRSYSLAQVMAADGVPRCDCGGVVEPDVVLYQDPLDPAVWAAAAQDLAAADLLIIGGTSLSVYPAANLIDYFPGDQLVVVNRDGAGGGLRRQPSLVITEPIAQTFAALDGPPL
jgi:NAD-dependent deacetylase